MNVCKKILALLLAMMLLLSMAPAAMAETGSGATTGGTITIEGSGEIEYTVYLMYKIEKVETDNDTKYKYQASSDAWKSFAPVGYLTVDENGYVFWEKDTASPSDAAVIAQMARQYVAGKTSTITTVGTVKVDNPLPVTEDGYYLLVPNNDTASGVVIVEGGENQTVQEKASDPNLPSVTKLVKEDTGDKYVSVNTVDYGQVFDVKIEVETSVGATNYVLHDRVDDHLRICTATGEEWVQNGSSDNTSSVFSLKRDGNALTAGTHYKVEYQPDDGCTFHIAYNVENFNPALSNDGVLLVEYKAKMVEDAGAQEDHKNTAWLTHGDINGTVKSNESETATQTFNVIVKKVDQDNDALAGAKFLLKDNVGRYYKLDNGKVTWVTEKEDAYEVEAKIEKTDGTQEAIAVFKGVDAELFTVVESVVPDGYIGVEETQVSTRADGKNSLAGGATFTTGHGQNAEVTIKNHLGNVLPETGGMGTTVFYGFGALLVAAAVVLLVLKKRAV